MFLTEFGSDNLNQLEGLKIAEVVSNADPKCQERVLVRIVGVHNMNNDVYENAIWAHHCSPFRDASGELPEDGDYVYVLFPDKHNPMACIWLGFVRSSFQEETNAKESEVTADPTGLQSKEDEFNEAEVEDFGPPVI